MCVYEEIAHIWRGKIITEQINSPVLCLEFHPTAHIVAIGTMDGSVLLYSAYSKKSKTEYNPGPLPPNDKFGALIQPLKYTPDVWVNSISWSQQGVQMCYSTQNSEIHVVYFTGTEPVHSIIKLPSLSCLSTCFLSDYAIACAGYDYVCYLCGFNGEKWYYIYFIL